jgi:alanine racemase
MSAGHQSRVILEVDLTKLRSNFDCIRQSVEPLDVMPVLKANAYGLGLAEISQCLKDAGACRFGVAELREALELSDIGLPVQILGGVIADEIPAAVEHGIVLPITDLETARLISAEAMRQNRTVECHFLIDTGMGRLGILLKDAATTIRQVKELPGLNCNGIYSHFPFAYGDYDFSCHQVTAFVALLEKMAGEGFGFEHVHMANSDAIHNIETALKKPFTMARTGINLYGCFDLEGRKTLPLQEVLTLKSRLVGIRDMPWGASLGYGRTVTLNKPTRVGTVSIGYADGLPLSMSGNGKLIIRGKECPILGRVSMDYVTVSLDNVGDAELGDEVVCLGQGISVADWAQAKGTITYEIICSFGNRVRRTYV